MSKKNNIKQFINLKSNFETTTFLSNKYCYIYEKYYNLKYYDDVDSKKSRELEYELKHLNRLLCSCVYNDYDTLKNLCDNSGTRYKEKRGYKTIYNKLKTLVNKKIFFYDGSITLYNFLKRNRIKLNHSENYDDEKNYIDYYNSILSYRIYDDYLYYVLEIEETIINKIENEIGKEKIELVKNNPKSNQIISDNYFKSFNKIIRKIIFSLKNTEIEENDFRKIKVILNNILNKDFQKSLLIKDKDAIDELNNLIKNLNSMAKKYSLITKVNHKNISNEKYLLNTIFTNNSHVVENLLVELNEIIIKILNDISNDREKILNNLKIKEIEFSETIIKG